MESKKYNVCGLKGGDFMEEYSGKDKGEFDIQLKNLSWILGDKLDREDLCAHGEAIIYVGDERFEDGGSVSGLAMNLLKGITNNHQIGDNNLTFPCCAHSLIIKENGEDIDVLGCPFGIDWAIIHIGSDVKLITASGKETIISLKTYKDVAYKVADEVEKFYAEAGPRILPYEEYERNAFIIFWKEWHRRRNGIEIYKIDTNLIAERVDKKPSLMEKIKSFFKC
jgi:hypothetical protein